MSLPPIPPLNLNTNQSATANGRLSLDGASWGMGSGDWTVNIPTSTGAGLSLQGGASTGLPWLAIAAGGLLAFIILRKVR